MIKTSLWRLRGCLVMGGATALISGCSNPLMVRWDPPAKDQVQDHTMAYAQAYARNAGLAYKNAAAQEVQSGQQLGNGLIGLGGVLAALAAGKAHRDAFIFGGLLGGTSYAIGNWNISKQRQLVYLAGAEGIICARKAVSAFDIPDSERLAFGESLADLDTSLRSSAQAAAELNKALANAQGEVVANADDYRNLALSTATLLRAAIAVGQESLSTGRGYLTKSNLAGGELVLAVDRISTAVDKAVLDTVPDLSAIPKVVNGIAGFAGTFVPDSGLEATLTQSRKDALGLAASQASKDRRGQQQPQIPQPLSDLNRLTIAAEAELNLLQNAIAKVKGRATGLDLSASASGLADCGISVTTQLATTPTSIEMAGGVSETHGFSILGGTKPYVVRIQGAAPQSGFTMTPPVPFDSSVVLTGTSALSGTYSFKLLIIDSSNPPKQANVQIDVGKSAPPAAAKVTQQDLNPYWAQLVGLNKMELPAGTPPVSLQINSVEALGNDKVKIAVSCKTAPSSPLSNADAVTAILGLQLHGQKVSGILNPDRTQKPEDRLQVTSDDSKCLASSAQSQGSKRMKAPVNTPFIDSKLLVTPIQQKLCLDGKAVDGLWGPVTQNALDAWRKKINSQIRGPVTNDELKELQRMDDAKTSALCKK